VSVNRLSDPLIRFLWWLFLSAEGAFILLFIAFPTSDGNAGFRKVVLVSAWTLLCRILFWAYPRLGASAALFGIILSVPVLVGVPGELFASTFARLSIISLPTLLLGFLWGWRGTLACLIASVPTLILSESTDSGPTAVGALLLIATGASGAMIHHLLLGAERARTALETLALTDPLTKLGNRYALEANFRGAAQLSMWDVNGLKRINDERGHHAGDAYLLAFVKAYEMSSAQLGAPERLYRVGGDEFVGLHATTTDLTALREGVLARFPSISVGWALIGDQDLDTVLKEADRAMYLEKGRLLKTTVEF
jgi:diguanylate cyclase (GGDEF)-like protein